MRNLKRRNAHEIVWQEAEERRVKVLKMMAECAEKGKPRPSEVEIAKKIGCATTSISGYIRTLCSPQDGRLIRHGTKGLYTYTVVSTGKTTALKQTPHMRRMSAAAENARDRPKPSLARFSWDTVTSEGAS